MIKKIVKILKRIMIGILSIFVVITLVGVAFVNVSPQFGSDAKDVSLERIRKSPNFLNGAFKNSEKTIQNTGFKWSTIPKFFTDGNNKTPSVELPMEKLSKSYFENEPKQPRITWFGHSAAFVEMEGMNIFIDPMLGDVPAPHPLLGSKRFQKELPISIDSLPKIDVVLISHDHYDHLDYGSVVKLKDKVGQFYVPLGIKAHLTSWGIDTTKIIEFDWWESINYKGIEFISTPARHFSGRGVTNRNSTLWCSWVLKSENSSIFFSGDSGYGKHFKEIGDKYGPFDFAMMECGQYNEQWSQIHMTPEETIIASIEVQSKLTMPIHWGSFKLALHSWDDPILRASVKAKELNIKFSTPKVGESIVLNQENFPNESWWLN
ncbi:MBL fold metallo-hydrolase [Lutibacter flavus]|uniref:L-ascorbate metabolism protein UlaG, beta-lactamase superfamily n=1 Tax=Lutibacter flavus TaxID=691689 RepID=A0A238X0V8_9FLAO|nr:MBL fold metallo-hydrolase [Lutibacter flavus]SNR52467.1 L-ascorbate metabolism protein UlaG, beta-lactamase superfamily [Lutibacter flavus]